MQIDPATGAGSGRRHGRRRRSSTAQLTVITGGQGHAVVHRAQDRHHRRSREPRCRSCGPTSARTSSIRWRRARPARGKAILEFLRGNRSRRRQPRSASSASASAACSAISSTRSRSTSARRARRTWTATIRAIRHFKDAAAFKPAGARSMSAPTTACCMRSTTPPATRPGRSCRASCSAPGRRPAWARLSYQDGALPPFQHHFYVDATPQIIDVNFGGGDVRLAHDAGRRSRQGRQVVLRARCHRSRRHHQRDRGGEAVLWEFTDADMGYSYGRPIIAKTHAFSGAVAGDRRRRATTTPTRPVGQDLLPARQRRQAAEDADDGRRARRQPVGPRAYRGVRARTSATSSPSRSMAAICWAISGASTSPASGSTATVARRTRSRT